MRFTSYGALPSGLDRSGLLAEVSRCIEELIPRGARAAAALSGGPDSTALVYLVAEARPDLQLCAAHVRHGLRDDAEDAAVAAAHARALGLEFFERSVRVAAAGAGPEAAAREARYAALSQIAQAVGARWLLVGHTADDQAETVLLNLVRGAGLRGLSGMAAVRAGPDAGDEPEEGVKDLPDHGLRIVRPLLRVRRDDVRTFVEGEGLQAVSDPTNRDPEQRRARARHLVIPALATLSGGAGDPVAGLARLADLARDDADALDLLAADHARGLLLRWGPAAAIAVRELEALPRALASRIVRLLLARMRGGVDGLTADAVAAVLGLAPGRALHVPGGAWVTAGGGWLAAAPAGCAPLAAREVTLPGATPLPEIGLVLHSDHPEAAATQPRLEIAADGSAGLRRDAWLRRQAPPAATPPAPLANPPPGAAGPAWALIPGLEHDQLPLRVRARRPADRIRLPGGTRKLQDVFVDSGVPRALRDLIPVVVDAGDEPVWIPGLALRHGDPAAGQVRLWLAPAEGV